MAQKNIGFKKYKLIKTAALGTGSYGAVYKAMCDDLPCAGKILHPTLFQSNDPGAMTIMRRFQQECSFLSAIRHPNIVQYLASWQDPETRLPVLLMELMDDSLTKFLEQSQEPLSFHTQVNICHDVALALGYLHSNDIIHRDLSSNNVLLIGAGNRAKVTDFGMAKLFDINRTTLTLQTMCPGTEVYMSPEALDDPPVYTMKLDIFSFGVLAIQIITRLPPSPGPRTKKVRNPRNPRRMLQEVIPDTDRRKSHIDKINSHHPLRPIAINCLSFSGKGRCRPSAEELCHHLVDLKETPRYNDSVQADIEDRERQIRKLRQEKDELQQQKEEIQVLRYQLQVSNEERRAEIASKQQEIQHEQSVCVNEAKQLDKLNLQMEDVKHTLAQNKEKILEGGETIQRLQETISHLQQQLQEKDKLLQHSTKVTHRRQQIEDFQQQLQFSDDQIREKNKVITENQETMQELRQQLGQQVQETQDLEQQLRVSGGHIREKDAVIAEKEVKILQLGQQLRHQQSSHIREKNAVVTEKRQEIQQLRQQLKQQIQRTQTLRQQLQGSENQVQQNDAVVTEKEQEIWQLRQQLGEQIEETRDLEQQLRVSGGHIREQKTEIQQLKQQLRQHAQQKQNRQQLRVSDGHIREKNAVVAEKQEEIQQLRQQIQTLQQQLQSSENQVIRNDAVRVKQPQELKQQLRASEQKNALLQKEFPQQKKLSLSWKMCKAAPCEMQRGSATVCGNMAYFEPDGSYQVYSYNSDTEKWSTLPECHSRRFTLTVINDLVTAVGGEQPINTFIWKQLGYYESTNKLLSLMEVHGKRKWVEQFPAMPTKRTLTAVVYSGKFLVVAGGYVGNTILTTVEVMDTGTRRWSTVSSLPHPLSDASATVCGDRLYLIGGKKTNDKWTESVFTCCLSALIERKKRLTEHAISDLKVCQSTCVTLNGQLLAVGGCTLDGKATNSIYLYNTETNSWDVISHMPTPQSRCLVTVLPGNKLMVAGSATNVDIAEVGWFSREANQI